MEALLDEFRNESDKFVSFTTTFLDQFEKAEVLNLEDVQFHYFDLIHEDLVGGEHMNFPSDLRSPLLVNTYGVTSIRTKESQLKSSETHVVPKEVMSLPSENEVIYVEVHPIPPSLENKIVEESEAEQKINETVDGEMKSSSLGVMTESEILRIVISSARANLSTDSIDANPRVPSKLREEDDPVAKSSLPQVPTEPVTAGKNPQIASVLSTIDGVTITTISA